MTLRELIETIERHGGGMDTLILLQMAEPILTPDILEYDAENDWCVIGEWEPH